MKITVLGAAGGIGRPMSMLLKFYLPPGSELTLYDISPVTPGVAKDLSHVPTAARVQGFCGDDPDEALEGADAVLVPAGVPRKPGMTRADLLDVNAGIVVKLVTEAARVCPQACVGIITNPINQIVPLAARLREELGVGDPRKLFGVTTLDTLRAMTFIAESRGGDPRDVQVRVVGGHSETTILPLLSQVRGAAFGNREVESLTARIRKAGTEVVEAMAGGGSATLSMAAAGCHFALALMRGLAGEEDVEHCAYVQGDGTHARFFAQPVRLGRNGAEEFLPLGPLSIFEQTSLEALLPVLHRDIKEGEALYTARN